MALGIHRCGKNFVHAAIWLIVDTLSALVFDYIALGVELCNVERVV